MESKELIQALRSDAEWAHANEWETPITLGDHLDAAADALATLLAEVERLNAELQSENTQNAVLRRAWRKLTAQFASVTAERDTLKERTADARLQLRTETFSTDKGAADLANFILSILPEAPKEADNADS